MKRGTWKLHALGELCDVIAGQSPEGTHYNNDGKGVPFYQGKKDFGERFIGAPTVWTTQTTKLALEGDVLMSVRAPVGPVNLAAGRACIGRGLAAIRVRDGLDRDFLYYQLLHLQSSISGTEGAVFSSINKSQIEALPIVVVGLEEQHRTVGILDRAFEGIATAKANAEKNIRNARALFLSHTHAVFGEAWSNGEIVKLSDLSQSITDGDHMPPPKSSTGIPFITIGNVVKETREIDFSDTFKVPHNYFDALKPSRKPQLGDVLYTVTGSFGIPVLVRDSADFCFQRHIALIRPKPDVESNWLYYLLLSPQIVAQAEAGATGAAQRTVSLSLLRSFNAPRLGMEAQQRAVKQLDAMFAKTQLLVSLHSRKLQALDALEKSILHQAYYGRV